MSSGACELLMGGVGFASPPVTVVARTGRTNRLGARVKGGSAPVAATPSDARAVWRVGLFGPSAHAANVTTAADIESAMQIRMSNLRTRRGGREPSGAGSLIAGMVPAAGQCAEPNRAWK